MNTLLSDCLEPVILDADGINVLLKHTNILRDRTGVTILTPHEGEFLRLGGSLSGNRRLDTAELACRLHSILGKAGNICARGIGQYGILPQDLLNVLPRLLL